MKCKNCPTAAQCNIANGLCCKTGEIYENGACVPLPCANKKADTNTGCF